MLEISIIAVNVLEKGNIISQIVSDVGLIEGYTTFFGKL
jgi:hypothetical protein